MKKEEFYSVEGIHVTVDEECGIFGVTDEEIDEMSEADSAVLIDSMKKTEVPA